MGSRVIVNGRTVVASRSWKPFRPGVVLDPVLPTGELLSSLSTPVQAPPRPVTGVPWHDSDGVIYRIVHKLNLAEGWIIAETVMRWYQCSHVDVLELARRGLLDAAMERGSPTKRYLVRDPRTLLETLRALRPEPPPAKRPRGRPRKNPL